MTEQPKIPVGILLLTHGRLGEALVECASHVLGGKVPEHIAILSAGQDEPVDEVVAKARQLVASLDQGGGVLVLTDLLGVRRRGGPLRRRGRPRWL